jgi:hypothetical protein
MNKLKIFIGWDSREVIAYDVCKYSILKYSPNIEIIPLKQYELRERGIYWREEDKKASTEFTLTRFLVPYLCNYTGYAIFIDCDTVLQDDIGKIMLEINIDNAITCVPHVYTPKTTMKMDKKNQYSYPRKNWSSVMVFNCKHKNTKQLTLATVNNESPMYLHRMYWAKENIGVLNHTWNYLVGYYSDLENPKLIHYTDGGPWFPAYRNCEFNDIWINTLKEMLSIK